MKHILIDFCCFTKYLFFNTQLVLNSQIKYKNSAL